MAVHDVTAVQIARLAKRAEHQGQKALSLALKVVAAAEYFEHTNALVQWLRPFAQGGMEAVLDKYPHLREQHPHLRKGVDGGES